ncbi:proteasome subunit beta type-2-A, putative [Entamoeba invadens IP1]|uniref:proteasome subunit beta type-2-A, putative n=1 Tax=Entamoeba invadens IP1 TaxID=370355 RepID=UPI0002C3D700|nr:proteasome subunit beta type-2-A, putative [Entamoeba invadens IP1]ELP93438.1 proteasome subunit beta type-2-A, putative [Entamoeba invadens IP1]|eukprot:XP_004260209.1 proteasome subunit beta type-2-A, putative [Entamoeba invadens IP1]
MSRRRYMKTSTQKKNFKKKKEMDSSVGIVGKDFVLFATDGSSGRGSIIVKNDLNKIYPLQGNRLMAIVGEANDRQALADFVQRNIALNYYRNGLKSTTSSVAHWVRQEMSENLRKGKYQCSVLIGGVDEAPELYLVDQLGALVQENYAAHGVGSHFVLALLDKHWHQDMEYQEALQLLEKCIDEIKRRVLVSSSEYCVEACFKDKTVTIKGPKPFPPQN